MRKSQFLFFVALISFFFYETLVEPNIPYFFIRTKKLFYFLSRLTSRVRKMTNSTTADDKKELRDSRSIRDIPGLYYWYIRIFSRFRLSRVKVTVGFGMGFFDKSPGFGIFLSFGISISEVRAKSPGFVFFRDFLSSGYPGDFYPWDRKSCLEFWIRSKNMKKIFVKIIKRIFITHAFWRGNREYLIFH